MARVAEAFVPLSSRRLCGSFICIYSTLDLQLNVMHLALTNDEGWRLEIPGLEELTSVGSKRCFGTYLVYTCIMHGISVLSTNRKSNNCLLLASLHLLQ